MSKKFSQFIAKDVVADSDFVNVTRRGANRRVAWPEFLDNIYDRIVTPFIYPTIVALQEAPLRADEDDPVYVRVEETGYRLYKITNIAPGAQDIVLDNGNTATAQIINEDMVDAVADISGLSLGIGSVIETKGCLSVGDGGQGLFIVQAASGTPDGYSRILMANGNHAVLLGPYNLRQFGAVADYNTSTMTGTDNSPALARAIAAIPAKTLTIPKGDYGIGTAVPIVFNNPFKMIGDNRRFGSRLFFFGTGPRSVRTQVIHPDDGTDAPMSAAISIESQQVHFEDLYISNAFNGTLPAGDFGSDWDCGIFVKAYSFHTRTRCRIDGYWRVAGSYWDVTRTSGNCDGATLIDDWSQGLWGMRIVGPSPKSGETEILPGDLRGAGGFSDLTVLGSSRYYDMNHHSGVRASDTDGGALYVSGHLNTPSKALQGHHFYGARFTSFSPWMIYVGRSSRDNFIACQAERKTGQFKVDGTSPVTDADVVIDITSEARYTKFDKSIWYNLTFTQNGSFFERLNCISGTSFGQSPLPDITQFEGSGSTSLVLTSSVGGALNPAQYSGNAVYTYGKDGQVTVQGRIVLTDKTGLSGSISLTGLPFANRNATNAHATFRINTFNVGFGIGDDLFGQVSPNSTTILIYLLRPSGTTFLTDAELANNSIISYTFSYTREM